MEGTYLNCIANTANLGKQCMFSIIENKKEEITLAHEVEVVTMCIKNPKKGVTLIVVITARP